MMNNNAKDLLLCFIVIIVKDITKYNEVGAFSKKIIIIQNWSKHVNQPK